MSGPRRAIESVYGAIIIAILISLFVGLYISSIERQQKSYENIVGSLEIESRRFSEKVSVKRSGNEILVSSSVDTRVIAVVARSGNTTYLLDLRDRPIEIRQDTYTTLPSDVRDWIETMWRRGLDIYMVTSNGNMIAVDSPADLSQGGYIGSCFPYDIVFDGVRGVYYIIYGTWTAYIQRPDTGTYAMIPTYTWDINTSYTIFRSPIDGKIFLRRATGSLPILETRSWFRYPTVMYAPDPTDLRVLVRIFLESPYGENKWVDIYYGSGTTNITYVYNGSVVVTTSALWYYGYGVIYSRQYPGTVPVKTYNFTVYIVNYVALPLYLTYYVYVYPSWGGWNNVRRDVAWVGSTGDMYYPYLVSNVIYVNGRELYINSITYYKDWSFSLSTPYQSNQLVSPYANSIDLYIGVQGWLGRTYTLQIVNTTVYTPNTSGYIVASNGNTIYDLTPLFYYGWVYR